MDQSSPNSENLTDPLNPESAAAILDEVIASVDLGLGLGDDSSNVNQGDEVSTLSESNQPVIAMEVDDTTPDLVDDAQAINNPVPADNTIPSISAGMGVEAMDTDVTSDIESVMKVVTDSITSDDKCGSSEKESMSLDDEKNTNVSVSDECDKTVVENVKEIKVAEDIDELAKETQDVRLRSPVRILEEVCLQLRDNEGHDQRENEQESMEVDTKMETTDKPEQSTEITEKSCESSAKDTDDSDLKDKTIETTVDQGISDEKQTMETNKEESKNDDFDQLKDSNVNSTLGTSDNSKNDEIKESGLEKENKTNDNRTDNTDTKETTSNSTLEEITAGLKENETKDDQVITDNKELKEKISTDEGLAEKNDELSKSDTITDKIIDQKETHDSNHGSPDNTEFVTTEGDDKNDTLMDSADDPIAGESNTNDKTESEECILPDSEMTEANEDDDEEYIVTKINEPSPKECMQCNKSEIPKYACKVGEKHLFLCNEDCLKILRERKTRVIVRDLRVKTFAVVDPSGFIKETLNKCHCCKTPLEGNVFYNWNVMNFCCTQCLANYQKKLSTVCVQCMGEVPNTLIGKYSVRFGMEIKQFCKNSCLLEHKRSGMRFCYLCQAPVPSQMTYPGYCTKTCYQVSKGIKNHGICAVCKMKKIQEIQYDNGSITVGFCGDPCFVAYKFVNNVNPTMCEFCKISKDVPELPHGFWLCGKRHQFCSGDCQKLFIATTRKIVHCKTCNVKKYDFDMVSIMNGTEKMTVCSLNCYNLINMNSKNIKNVCDLCCKHVKPQFYLRTLDNIVHNFCTAECLKIFKDHLNKTNSERTEEDATPTVGVECLKTFKDHLNKTNSEQTEEDATPTVAPASPQKIKKIVVIRPREIPSQRNVATMCKPNMVTKAVSCKPRQSTASCQTDTCSNKFVIPIPIPVFVPIPMAMYSQSVPCPVPIPIPLPVPIFIPTQRNSVKGIMKEMKKIKNKTPANPLEAELLMMAEMVAEDKKNPSDSESDTEAPKLKPETSFGDEPMETNNFGEDVIQMALKMAGDFDEPSDIEVKTEDSTQRIENIMETKRRNIRQARQGKQKKSSLPEPSSDAEKPDANMCLKYTFGVNAWKQWVTTKNLELQKTSKKAKLFKTEVLHLTADELNFSLCLFVKEVRKPNGSEYAPDTIYYLCLGIQQYLYENSRIDNIFCDPFYDKFTDCLNEVCQKFSVLYNESQYIVTRVEEEHLWEAKQLGAHSPLVLLNTLMFFNTKHFSLTTVTEHLQLSFSHIMKHWKRNPHQPGSRNVLLRFYPPQSADGSRKKKVYEQHENDVNPIRCPVKLYEFYLSKCPESVKTRNDVFYLQPERSCVPDSPVWYSTMPQEQEPLEKMLNRVKMVKEINIAILTT